MRAPLDRLPGWVKPALIGAVATLLLVVVLGQLLPKGYSGATKAVDAYLTAIEKKDFDKAYELLCRASKRGGRKAFDAQTAEAAAGKSKVRHEMIGSKPARDGRSTVQFRQVTSSGKVDLAAQAVEENGEWKFCGYEDIALSPDSQSGVPTTSPATTAPVPAPAP